MMAFFRWRASILGVSALMLGACGAKPSGGTPDGGNGSISTTPPILTLGQGVGVNVSGAGLRLNAELGAPLAQPVKGSKGQFQPGLLPQTEIR